jgi:hypothetical protein
MLARMPKGVNKEKLNEVKLKNTICGSDWKNLLI